MSPEVLIYIQNVKTYFKNNDEARSYFLNNSDEDLFFEHLTNISIKNYENNGDASLDVQQFELLRKTVIALTIAKKEIPSEDVDQNIFFEIPNFGKICLN